MAGRRGTRPLGEAKPEPAGQPGGRSRRASWAGPGLSHMRAVLARLGLQLQTASLQLATHLMHLDLLLQGEGVGPGTLQAGAPRPASRER